MIHGDGIGWWLLWNVCIKKKTRNYLVCQPIYSIEALSYLESIDYKIHRGLNRLKFWDVHDEFNRCLSEQGMLHPHWTEEDIEFVKKTTVNSSPTADIYKEILSFRRQRLTFTYELLGLNHENIDEVFNWMRMTGDSRFYSVLDEVDTPAKIVGSVHLVYKLLSLFTRPLFMLQVIMSLKRGPLQAMETMVDQLSPPAPVPKKKLSSKKQQSAAAIWSSSSLPTVSSLQHQRPLETILPTMGNHMVVPQQQSQVRVDYYPNQFQHITPMS